MRSPWRGAIALALIAGTIAAPPARADHDSTCADVTLIFARGSGQDLGEREAPAYLARLEERLGEDVDVNTYELGEEAHDSAQYPAVDANFRNIVSTNYFSSVDEGVDEYVSYLTDRAAACPDEIFAVGGYSQGAHTTGDMLYELPTAIRDRIAHVALVGDPKLYLPEGVSLKVGPVALPPPACIGRDFSVWRRGNVSCFTDNGILGARTPDYIPVDIQSRTGSWCDRNDPICNGNVADFAVSAHGFYAEPGAELDEAVREAAEAIAALLPEDRASGVDITPFYLAAGSDGLDVAFVVDTTGSMGGLIGEARSIASSFAGIVTTIGGRVALTEYRDAGDAFTSRVRVGLTGDVDAFRSTLDTLSPNGGGDTPEATLDALMTTMNTLEWRDGATKAAIVLTDAGYHDPDRAGGWTTADVVRRSAEIDPVNVFVVGRSSLASAYSALTTGTAGRFVALGSDPSATLEETITEITTRPVVFFDVFEYFALPEDTIRFSVNAYDIDADIVSYEWDVDLDGTIDATTTEPELEWSYGRAFDGLAEVRAISSDGGVGSATVPVIVDPAGMDAAALAPAAPVDAAVTDDGDGTATLSWQPGEGGGEVVQWTVEVDGDIVATLDAAELSVSGLPAGVEYRLQAHNQYRSSEVVVIGTDPLASLQALRADVEAADMNPGVRRALLAHLDAASRAATDGRDPCEHLDRFEDGADRAGNRGFVAPAVADDWISRSERIGTALGCP